MIIWNAFETAQPGFFSEVLEAKYNIGSNFTQKIQE